MYAEYYMSEKTRKELEEYERKRNVPSIELLMKVFRIFDKHGLIRDDLCFDPEHFMETVVKEHWNDEE